MTDKSWSILRNPAAHGVVVFFLGAGLLRFLDLIERVPETFLKVISIVTIVTPPNASVQLTAWARSGSVLVYVFLVAVLATAVAAFSHYVQIRHDGAAAVRRLLPETAPIYKAMVTRGAKVTLQGIDRRLTVKRDYSVVGLDVFTLGAATEPLSGLAVELSSNIASPGIPSIKFRATLPDSRSHSIVTLPAEDSDGRKRFVTFFFPPLVPGGPVIKNRHTWVWRAAAKKLRQPGVIDRNVMSINPRASGPVDSVRFVVEVEADGEFAFECEYPEDEARLVRCESDSKRMTIELSDVPPGTQISIAVFRRRAAPETAD